MIDPGRERASVDVDRYRAILARDLPDRPLRSFRPLGEGEDHLALEIDGDLIVRFAKDGDGAALAREARLLRHLHDISPVPVPRPSLLHEAHGYCGYPKLPGTPLIALLPDFDLREWPDFAGAIGAFLSAINAVSPAALGVDLDAETDPPGAWQEEARQIGARLRDRIPPRFAGAIAAFFAAPPPAAPFPLVVAHNDLGAEHILVDPAARQITGIIDWGDAALADPAYDLGKLCRDLGGAALDAILRHYTVGGDHAALRERAMFYARCGLFEDWQYGLETGRAEYVEKSIAALSWLFP